MTKNQKNKVSLSIKLAVSRLPLELCLSAHCLSEFDNDRGMISVLTMLRKYYQCSFLWHNAVTQRVKDSCCISDRRDTVRISPEMLTQAKANVNVDKKIDDYFRTVCLRLAHVDICLRNTIVQHAESFEQLQETNVEVLRFLQSAFQRQINRHPSE